MDPHHPAREGRGRLAEAYAWQARQLGAPTTFTQLGSLEPELVHARLALYRASERTSSKLTARQKNLISHVVSSANETPHCASRSAIKLRELGFSEQEIGAVENEHFDDLAPEEAAVARYALKLTRHPGSISQDDVDAPARRRAYRPRHPRRQQPDRPPQLHQPRGQWSGPS